MSTGTSCSSSSCCGVELGLPSPIRYRFVDRDMFMRYEWGLAVGHTYTHKNAAVANQNILELQRGFGSAESEAVQPLSSGGGVPEAPFVPTGHLEEAQILGMGKEKQTAEEPGQTAEGGEDREEGGDGEVDSEDDSDDSDGDCSGLEGYIDELEDEKELFLFGDNFGWY